MPNTDCVVVVAGVPNEDVAGGGAANTDGCVVDAVEEPKPETDVVDVSNKDVCVEGAVETTKVLANVEGVAPNIDDSVVLAEVVPKHVDAEADTPPNIDGLDVFASLEPNIDDLFAEVLTKLNPVVEVPIGNVDEVSLFVVGVDPKIVTLGVID